MEQSIPDVAVRPDGEGAFQAVSDATGSERTAAAIRLGALWNSIPELTEAPLDGMMSDPAVMFLADSQPALRGDWESGNGDTPPPIEYLRATVCVNEETPSAAGCLRGDPPWALFR